MTREDFTARITGLEKLIRTEYGLHQDQMAEALGISKKTLVETEKGRRQLTWTESVALTAIFAKSRVLGDAFGGDLAGVLEDLAFPESPLAEAGPYPKTMGGRIWWRDVAARGGFRVQQNIISQHFRLLNAADERILSSFDREEVLAQLADLAGKEAPDEA